MINIQFSTPATVIDDGPDVAWIEARKLHECVEKIGGIVLHDEAGLGQVSGFDQKGGEGN